MERQRSAQAVARINDFGVITAQALINDPLSACNSCATKVALLAETWWISFSSAVAEAACALSNSGGIGVSGALTSASCCSAAGYTSSR